MAFVGQRNSELVLIAALPTGVIAVAKKAVPPVDLCDGYRREHDAWAGLFQLPAAEKMIRGGLEAGHRPGMASVIWKACCGRWRSRS